MRYWERIAYSQEKMSRDFPTGADGLEAILYLKSFFESMSCERLSQDHPLHNRLSVGYEPNYRWFVQYTRKIREASLLPGFSSVAKRLCDPLDFLRAQYEIEVALKMHLAELQTVFVPSGASPTPDLMIAAPGRSLAVEVSSLNPPDEEKRVNALLDRLLGIGIRNDVVTGGFIINVPSHNVIQQVVSSVETAVARAKESGASERVSLDGKVTVFVASRTKADLIPEECRGSYHMIGPSKLSITDQVKRKIGDKASQIFSHDKSGILCLYTELIDRKGLIELFERPMDEIQYVLPTYPRLLALSLTAPNLGFQVVSGQDDDIVLTKSGDHKWYLQTKVGQYQYETSILWINPYASQSLPEKVIEAFKEYSVNLGKLAVY